MVPTPMRLRVAGQPDTEPFEPEGRLASVVSLCMDAPDAPETLFVDHLTFGDAPDEASALSEIARVELLARLTRAFTRGPYVDAAPRERPESRVKGHEAFDAGDGTNEFRLGRSRLDVTLPSDRGAIWNYNWGEKAEAEGDILDHLDRVAPALPALTVSVGRPATCAEASKWFKPSRKGAAPVDVPAGWEWLGAVKHEVNGGHVLCRPFADGALIALVLQVGRAPADLAPVLLVLKALADARPVP